ncbi:MAG: EAL domain-containing protein [Gammaproteobacteria bacterium]|nr:EAL domain-containing protein [Gammaproteobacteria bacterium]
MTPIKEVLTLPQCEILSNLINVAQIIVLILDKEGNIVSFNHYMAQISGYPLDEVRGKNWVDTFLIKHEVSEHSFKGNINSIRIKEGTERIIEWFDHKICDDNKNIEGILKIGLDITDKMLSEEKLTIFKRFAEASNQGLCWTNLTGHIQYSNRAFAKIVGERHQNVLLEKNMIHYYFLSKEQHKLKHEIFPNVLTEGLWSGELLMQHQSGEQISTHNHLFLIRNKQLKPLYIATIINDMSDHKEYKKNLEYIAYHDSLTQLPNRVLLTQRLQKAMQTAKDNQQYLAVVSFDLDGFKKVNDTHGHDIGDQLLIKLAEYLKSITREGDTLSRIGGDEFVFVLTNLLHKEHYLPLLERFLTTFSTSMNIGQLSFQLSASIGISLYPKADDIDAEQLIRQSDQAMYHAKLSGKNCHYIFDDEQDKTLRGHHQSIARIREAMRNNEFVLHYQPKVNMRTGELVGAEALIRWQHPEHNLLSPEKFIPIIENDILSVELGYWVIDTALSALKNWHLLGLKIVVSVNISAIHLLHTGFVEQLKKILGRYPEVSNHYFELEILETSAIEDIELVSKIMCDCQKIGVNFSLDDFGTGYSSLSYLKRLPVQTIKIDQTFVRDMLEDPDDLAILEGIIALATAFKRHCIAEGVETAEHGELLLQMDCELAQGYGISRPMEAEKLPIWIKQWKPAPIWKNAQSVKRKNLPLIYSSVENYAWIHNIEKKLTIESDVDLSQVHCHFSQWLTHVGKKHYGFFDELTSVASLHHNIRQLGIEVLDQIKSNQRDNIEEKITTLYKLQNTLSLNIKILIHKIQN